MNENTGAHKSSDSRYMKVYFAVVIHKEDFELERHVSRHSLLELVFLHETGHNMSRM